MLKRKCSKCDENYFAKGLCKYHYRQKWKKENPNYNKNYSNEYWLQKKQDPEYLKKRKAYMKKYNDAVALQKKLTNESISKDFVTLTVTLP